ncbi:MAG: MlaD family protein [Saprospiraceae bacterium]
MRKETKIGLFAIITIAAALWGYQYLRGFNVLAKKTTLYAIYEDVSGLRVSTPIRIHGLQVGLVADFEQVENDLNKIKVTFNLDDGIKVPKNTRAELVSASLMGGSEIHLKYAGTCEGSDCAQDGDYLQGVTQSLIGSFTSPEEMKTYMEELTQGLGTVIDTLNARLANSEELQKSITDAKAILANLNSTTGRIDRLMAGSSSSIEGSLKNVESITGNLKNNNEKITAILDNAEKLSNDLKAINMAELSGDVQKTMAQLQTTLASSDKAINDLGALLKSLNEGGEGAVAMLLHDKSFADNLQKSVKDLDLLLEDVRLHPERYRRILSKKKMPYEAPEEKN